MLRVALRFRGVTMPAGVVLLCYGALRDMSEVRVRAQWRYAASCYDARRMIYGCLSCRDDGDAILLPARQRAMPATRVYALRQSAMRVIRAMLLYVMPRVERYA